MKLTFGEWIIIKDALENDLIDYELEFERCVPSEEPSSWYQYWKPKIERAKEIIKRIETAEV